jgi:hypothetical protein
MTIMSSGCVAPIVYETQIMDSSTQYGTAKTAIPRPPPGMGRLFVYLTAGGPNASWIIGIGPSMNGYIVIDDNTLFEFLGGSYFYVDLPTGPHSIHAGEIASSLSKIRKGTSFAIVTVTETEESFVRIDLKGIGLGTKAFPIAVRKETAEQEMNSLRREKSYKPHDVQLAR